MKVNLKYLRSTKGWTQSVTATNLGVSLDYVRSLESGRKSPSLKLLQKIKDVFDCHSLDDVFHSSAS